MGGRWKICSLHFQPPTFLIGVLRVHAPATLVHPAHRAVLLENVFRHSLEKATAPAIAPYLHPVGN